MQIRLSLLVSLGLFLPKVWAQHLNLPVTQPPVAASHFLEPLQNKLFEALEQKNYDRAKQLLGEGASVNALDKQGVPLLFYCVMHNDLECCTFLLEHGADILLREEKSLTTALHRACDMGFFDIAKCLVAKKGSKAVSEAQDFQGFSPLHSAAASGRVSLAEMLILDGARVEMRSREGLLPIHIAAQEGHSPVLEILLDHSVGINVGDDDGLTALHWAARNGRTSCINLLISRNALIDKVDKKGRTALSIAALSGHAEALTLLLSSGAQKNLRDGSLSTPLHLAARNGHLECVKILLAKGSNAEVENLAGHRPLHEAVEGGSKDCVKALLGSGSRNGESRGDILTPLKLACKLGNLDCAKLILASFTGKEKSSRCWFDELIIAAQHGHSSCVQLMLTQQRKLSIGQQSILDRELAHVVTKDDSAAAKALILAGADRKKKPDGQNSLLHLAAQSNAVTCVKTLLPLFGVDVVNNDGMTPLHSASKAGALKSCAFLMSSGASVRAVTKSGLTPLHFAAEFGGPAALALLIEKDAPLDQRDAGGEKLPSIGQR